MSSLRLKPLIPMHTCGALPSDCFLGHIISSCGPCCCAIVATHMLQRWMSLTPSDCEEACAYRLMLLSECLCDAGEPAGWVCVRALSIPPWRCQPDLHHSGHGTELCWQQQCQLAVPVRSALLSSCSSSAACLMYDQCMCTAITITLSPWHYAIAN